MCLHVSGKNKLVIGRLVSVGRNATHKLDWLLTDNVCENRWGNFEVFVQVP